MCGFANRTGDTLYAGADVQTRRTMGGHPIETEVRSVLVKDAIVILVAVGGLLAFYTVLMVVRVLANIQPLP